MKTARDGMVVGLALCFCGIVYLVTQDLFKPISSEFIEQTIRRGLADATNEGIRIGRRAAPHERGNSSAPSLASQDSSGFLEYSDEQWMRMRRVHQAQSLRQRGIGMQSRSGRHFFQSNWEPTLSCAFEQRLGKIGDGGKWVCDAYRLTSTPKP